MIVAGLDLSLTSTGVAMANPAGGHVSWRVQSSGKATASLRDRRDRLRGLADKICSASSGVAGADLVVIEGPAYSRTMGSMHDRSGLWWLVTDQLSSLGLNVAEVTPTVRSKYATGAGNAGKDAVLAAAVKRYPDWDITGNDIADAVILAAMGCRHLGHPIDSLPQIHLSAMTKVRWPGVAP